LLKASKFNFVDQWFDKQRYFIDVSERGKEDLLAGVCLENYGPRRSEDDTTEVK
jgi:hypothetical protein